MTWINLGVRALSLGAVLPLIVRTFTPSDISLYYLFASAASFQLLVVTGFDDTFSRFISYAIAWGHSSPLGHPKQRKNLPDRVVSSEHLDLSAVLGTLDGCYRVLSLAIVPVMILIGLVFLRKPISMSSDVQSAWTSWSIVVLSTPAVLYGSRFSAILQGAGWIAVNQRWSALFALGSLISSFIILLFGGALLPLILSTQIWQIMGVIRLYWLSRKLSQLLPMAKEQERYDRAILSVVWPAAWRSTVGSIASTGITYLVAFAFSQRFDSLTLATFLIAQRFINFVSEICRAPFYSKIPQLNQQRLRHDIIALRHLAQKGMRYSYASFLISFFALPLLAPRLFAIVGSKVTFPDLKLWTLLGAATLVERFGAMHIQLYSTTNHIIWHWLNGVTGILWLALITVLVPKYGLLSYPIAMLVSYMLVYTNVSVRWSLRSLNIGFLSFERSTFLPALGTFLLAAGILWSTTIKD